MLQKFDVALKTVSSFTSIQYTGEIINMLSTIWHILTSLYNNFCPDQLMYHICSRLQPTLHAEKRE